MKRVAPLVVLLLTAQTARAAPLQLHLPTPEVRRERWAAIGLGLAGAALIAIGAPLSTHDSSSGISVATIGGGSALASLYMATHEAGHDRALHEVDRDGDLVLERLAGHAHRVEVTGIAMTVVGVAFFAVGLGLAMDGVQHVCVDIDGGNRCAGHSDRGGELAAGMTVSLLGDAGWLAGSFVWAYGSGLRGGVAEARGSIRASASGVAGTF